MEVFVGACHRHLHICQTAHPTVDGGCLVRYHCGVRHQTDIGAEHLFVLFEKWGQRRASNLFFAFENEFYIMIELSGAYQVFKYFDMHEQLAFIIVGATSPNGAVTDYRFKGVGMPFLKRLGRLYVVMAVNEYGFK